MGIEFQEYKYPGVPPVAFAVAVPLDPPKQLTLTEDAVTEGFGCIVSSLLFDPEQPAVVPVTE